MKTVRIELPILLPDIPDARDTCVQRLRDLLNQRRGVAKTHLIESGTGAVLCLHYDPNILTLDGVEQLAKAAGAEVRERYGHRVWPLRRLSWRCMPGPMRLARSISFVTPGTTRKGRFTFDIDLLMLLAAIGAALLGEWAEGAFLFFLFSQAHALEHYALGRARASIRALADLAPAVARVEHGNRTEEAPVEAVQTGERVLVRPAERVPVDGRIVSGRSAINQAPITGESVPVDKAEGDEVFAGTINGEGADDRDDEGGRRSNPGSGHQARRRSTDPRPRYRGDGRRRRERCARVGPGHDRHCYGRPAPRPRWRRPIWR